MSGPDGPPDPGDPAADDLDIPEPVENLHPKEKPTERPHPLTPLIRGWVIFLLIIVAIGRELVPSGERRDYDPLALLQANLLPILGVILIIVMLVAIASFVTWWFTCFVIDDDELRIETGLLTKTSKRIPFQRVQSIDVNQPLAARMFGLAELRIDAGSENSTLRYLSRRKAYRLRDYLLSRAHGEQLTVADSAQRSPASAARDLSSADQILVTITPAQVIIGFLTSTDVVISGVISIIGLVALLSAGLGVFSLGVFIPIIFGTLRQIGSRLFDQFNYTLARTGQGLRITRGLTNLTSQSVPVDRIQGVRITRYLLWKALGYYRVDINVLGIAGASDNDDGAKISSILLPVATRTQLETGLAAILPGVDLSAIPLWRCPDRARWLRWLSIQTFRWGHDARVAYARRGLIDTIAWVMPHTKVQSVRIIQGPLQRLVRVASVHLDSTPGPVTWIAPEIDPNDARAFALSELNRMRSARRAQTSRNGTDGH